ncbi:MAG: isoprenylcysteine carboxylmethyltransferase family protein [Spirochaetales bacterium]|nr:isoprenylcysteine carboxylmethyltransferase family protein [Spirochaetales bacterium]
MSVLLIVVYFAAWAGLHTTLASLKTKRLAARVFGDGARRWYRFAFVLVAVSTLMPLVGLMVRLPDRLVYAVPSPWRWLMVAGQIAALVGMVWTVRATDASDFVGLHQLRGQTDTFQARLVNRGLYRHVRHPMYTTSLLVMWLMPRMTLNLLVLFACISVYFVVGSFHEERLLVHQFGAQYEEYRRRVPRIVPRLPRGSRGCER